MKKSLALFFILAAGLVGTLQADNVFDFPLPNGEAGVFYSGVSSKLGPSVTSHIMNFNGAITHLAFFVDLGYADLGEYKPVLGGISLDLTKLPNVNYLWKDVLTPAALIGYDIAGNKLDWGVNTVLIKTNF